MNQKQLLSKLSSISEKLISMQVPHDGQPNRVFLLCESENSLTVNKFLFQDVGARFVIETAIDSDNCFEIIYHYSYDQTGTVIHLKVFIRNRQKPSVESLTPIIPAAEWIEREIHDLYGIEFRNHPRMERFILADNWPQGVYPMRKEVNK